jgi:hypothetical protein
MKKHIPILLQPELAQKAHTGEKTMTRRLRRLDIINEDPDDYHFTGFVFDPIVSRLDTDDPPVKKKGMFAEFNGGEIIVKCPYGQPGDIIWVRENFNLNYFELKEHAYQGAWTRTSEEYVKKTKFKPSIHMPKAACRTWGEIINIKVERVQSISEADAIKEGIRSRASGVAPYNLIYQVDGQPNIYHTAKQAFEKLWCSINGPESWKANPWVWAVEWKPISKPENFLNPKK